MKQISDMLQPSADGTMLADEHGTAVFWKKAAERLPRFRADDVLAASTAFETEEARRVIMVKPEEMTAEKPPLEQPSHCLLCGQVGPALLYGHWICDHCKNVVQAEALAKKRKIEKEGGGPA